MNYTFWKVLSWLFFSVVLGQSLYAGIVLGCWWGLISCVIGFGIGVAHEKYRHYFGQGKRDRQWHTTN